MSIDLWDLIKAVAIPVALVVVGFIWRRIDKNEASANLRLNKLDLEIEALRTQIGAAALEAERRYINWKHMDDFKGDIFKRFDRLERRLESLPGGFRPGAEDGR